MTPEMSLEEQLEHVSRIRDENFAIAMELQRKLESAEAKIKLLERAMLLPEQK